MSEETFHVVLVTPNRLVADKQVVRVTVPGVDGDFGVLAGHAPMLSTLRAGVLQLNVGNNEVSRFAICWGYAEVLRDRVIILTEESATVAEIDIATVEKERDDALTELEGLFEEEPDYRMHKRHLEHAQACLELCSTL